MRRHVVIPVDDDQVTHLDVWGRIQLEGMRGRISDHRQVPVPQDDQLTRAVRFALHELHLAADTAWSVGRVKEIEAHIKALSTHFHLDAEDEP